MYNSTNHYIDLHNHMGSRSLNDMILEASALQMSSIAITDHDRFTISKTIRQDDVEVLPGCEISVNYRDRFGKKHVIHMIALFFHDVPEDIMERVSVINNNDYINAMIDTLNRLGVPVTFEQLSAEYNHCKILERRNLVDLVVKKGYAATSDEALDRWLGKYSPYYINPLDYIHYIDLDDCVRMITKAGGIPIIAHPLLYFKNDHDELDRLLLHFRNLTDAPLGMEVYYGKYTEEQFALLLSLAKKYGLLPSAGSDSHKSGQPFVHADPSVLETLRREAQNYYGTRD